MTASEKAISMIKEYEGCSLTAYKDPVGILTIGYGHTAGVYAGQKITQLQADQMLATEVKACAMATNAIIMEHASFGPNQNQFDALVSFAYNCGTGNLTKLITDRSAVQVADAILLYNKAGGKELPGLTRRRKAERELFLTPVQAAAPSGSTLDLVYRTQKDEFGSGEDRRAALGSRYQEVQDMINHIATAPALSLVIEVKENKYGIDDVRRTVLADRYQEVQDMINHIERASDMELAREVLRRKYGDGETRKAALGKRWAEVQKIVNTIA